MGISMRGVAKIFCKATEIKATYATAKKPRNAIIDLGFLMIGVIHPTNKITEMRTPKNADVLGIN